jgi:uncharacterized protein YggE
MKTYRNYFHFTNKEKLSITARIPILSKVNAQTDVINNTLFVSDSTTSQAISDEITASMGVKTTNTSVQSALSSNSNFMNKILEALKATSVQENETSTATFSITPYYNYSSNTNQDRLIGLQVIPYRSKAVTYKIH